MPGRAIGATLSAMIEWHGTERITVGGRTFDVIDARPAGADSDATAIRKHAWCLARYESLVAELAPRRVVELGIDQGGSTVFLSRLCSELDRLLALDIGDLPAGLLRYLETGDGAAITAQGGVDQSDRARVASLVDDAFGDERLDLVVDDASHRLAPTRASFDLLFPRLRPGGVFVIEDWSWDHRVGRVIADRMAAGEVEVPDDRDAPPQPMPLSRLVLEAVLAGAHAPEVVADVRARQGWAEIVRGDAELDSSFALENHLGWTGEGVLDRRFTLS